MNACLKKYFDAPEITRNGIKNVLKNLLCAPLGELSRMEADGEFPACLGLLANALAYCMETGRLDAPNRIIDFVFDCKTVEELSCRCRLPKTTPA